MHKCIVDMGTGARMRGSQGEGGGGYGVGEALIRTQAMMR